MIKNIVFSLMMSLGLVFMVAMPMVAQAQAQGGCGALDRQFGELKGQQAVTGIPKYCSIFAAFTKFFNIASSIAGGIAVLLVLVGGFQYMTAAGNEKQAGTAKNTILYALIGLVVVIMAASIVNIVANLLK